MLSIVPKEAGWIEVICGSMFSGKTEELIRRLKRAQIAKLRVSIFKPHIDDRYSKNYLVSHNEQKISSVPVEHAEEILNHAEKADVIGIDEARYHGWLQSCVGFFRSPRGGF